MSAGGFGYAAAVALAVVLAVAAVAKARDLDGTAASFARLGLPRAATLARIVPAVEAGTAAVLVLTPALGGLVALALLAFFTTFLVSRLRAGQRAPCSCFGAARHQPLSPADVVGNGFLLVLAAAALAAPAPRVPGLFDLLALAVLGVADVGVTALVRRVDRGGERAERAEPSGPGAPAPTTAPDPTAGPVPPGTAP